MKTLALINLTTYSWGYLLIAVGLVIVLKINSAKYNRRGIGGLQHFNCHFLLAMLITSLEFIILRIGWILVLLGIFMSIHYPHN